jgi:hypothetical protein
LPYLDIRGDGGSLLLPPGTDRFGIHAALANDPISLPSSDE